MWFPRSQVKKLQDRAHSKLSTDKQPPARTVSLGVKENKVWEWLKEDTGGELLDTEYVENYFEKLWHKEKKQNTTKFISVYFWKMK